MDGSAVPPNVALPSVGDREMPGVERISSTRRSVNPVIIGLFPKDDIVGSIGTKIRLSTAVQAQVCRQEEMNTIDLRPGCFP